MKLFLNIIVLITYILLINPVEKFSKSKMTTESTTAVPDVEVVDIFALEFKNLVSDILFFDAITFIGGKKTFRLEMQEGEQLYSLLNASSFLNPYNVDPYYLGQSILTWETKMYDRANILLKRGMQYRNKEWVFPFFIAYNYFYFMNDTLRGAEYMKVAIERPGSPTLVLTTLASRLYYRSGRTEVGILLLKDAEAHEADEGVKKIYRKRIKAMEGVLVIEKAIEVYKNKYSRKPANIDMLIKAGLLKSRPHDPYGGQYYIDKEGNVKSTSDFR